MILAPNIERKRAMTPSKKIATLIALLASACSLTPSNAAASQEHPSFLEAAVFFLTGFEAKNIQNPTTLKITEETNVTFALDKNDPCVIIETSNASVGKIYYTYRPDFAQAYSGRGPLPANGSFLKWPMKRWQFDKMPSPATASYFGEWVNFPLDAKNMTVCTIEGDCGALSFSIASHPADINYRRTQALQYIRDNYCAGLPEPPQPPRKPY